MDTSLAELLTLVDGWEYEDDGWTHLERVEVSEDSVVLALTIKINKLEIETVCWTVTAQQVVGYRLQSELPRADYCLELTDNDPILRTYTDPYFTLAFLGRPRMCLALLHALQAAVPYHKCKTVVKTDPAFYQSGHGFAGRGPEFLMRACFPAMEAEGIEPYRAWNPIWYKHTILTRSTWP